jgi:hypothetical protein
MGWLLIGLDEQGNKGTREANAKCGAEVLVVDNRELGCSIHRLTTKHSIMYLSIH